MWGKGMINPPNGELMEVRQPSFMTAWPATWPYERSMATTVMVTRPAAPSRRDVVVISTRCTSFVVGVHSESVRNATLCSATTASTSKRLHSDDHVRASRLILLAIHPSVPALAKHPKQPSYTPPRSPFKILFPRTQTRT